MVEFYSKEKFKFLVDFKKVNISSYRVEMRIFMERDNNIKENLGGLKKFDLIFFSIIFLFSRVDNNQKNY